MFAVDASEVRRLMFEHDIRGVYELARQAGLNVATAAKVLRDGTRATAKTIAALARLFGVNGNELVKE